MPFLHIGDHTQLPAKDIPWHLIEPSHLFFGAMAVGVGAVAITFARRAAARTHAQRKDKRHDPR